MLRIIGLTALLSMQTCPHAAESLTVAIAANFKYAFDDLAAEFGKETGIDVKGVAGSSGKLAAQIKSGAPFDIFMSADMEYPETLYKGGDAVTLPKVYAYGTLVLWTRKDIDLNKGMQILTDPAVQKVAIANPKVAPYGREALKTLDFYKIRAMVEPKLVYGESITQVGLYIDNKAVDIGFSAKSLVVSPESIGKGTWIEVPQESHDPIAQGMVILRHGAERNAEVARKFFDFVFTPQARTLLKKNGYRLPRVVVLNHE